jgi:hypothetical protein
MPTLNEVATILEAVATVAGCVVIILNTMRQSVHSAKLDAITNDTAAVAAAVTTVASDVKVIAALQPQLSAVAVAAPSETPPPA